MVVRGLVFLYGRQSRLAALLGKTYCHITFLTQGPKLSGEKNSRQNQLACHFTFLHLVVGFDLGYMTQECVWLWS